MIQLKTPFEVHASSRNCTVVLAAHRSMRDEAKKLLAALGGASSSFVSLGKASGPHVGLHIDVASLPRASYGKAIMQVQAQVRSCAVLPNLPPASIAVVYSKGSTVQKWYASPPCPERAEKTLARALAARGKARSKARAASRDSSGGETDSDYITSSDDDDTTSSDDDDDALAGDMLSKLDRCAAVRNARTDDLYAWAAGCSDDESGYALPMRERDLEPTVLAEGGTRFPEVLWDGGGGDNMLGMLITQEVRRRQHAAGVADARADARADKAPPRKKMRRVPLQHLGVRDATGKLIKPDACWFLDAQGRTVLGSPPPGCKRHGRVCDGVLVGR